MKFADLSPEALEKIRAVRYDRILEKHEGPERWESTLKYYELEFLDIDKHPVLLPINRDHHSNITILRKIWSADGKSLTLFFKDTTFGDDWYDAGYMAVCDRITDEPFYLAVVYHEWFIIEPASVFEGAGGSQ